MGPKTPPLDPAETDEEAVLDEALEETFPASDPIAVDPHVDSRRETPPVRREEREPPQEGPLGT